LAKDFQRIARAVHYAYVVMTLPFAISFIAASRAIHPAYRVGYLKRIALGVRFFLNTVRVRTGTSYKLHLAMAMKLLELPPDEQGIVVECGAWKGGSAINLSLACAATGRELWIYDSFRGLPPPVAGDREAVHYRPGDYAGSITEVQRNLRRYGAPDRCRFVQGWFDETLSAPLARPVVLAFIDVDLEASLDTCVRAIWPALTPHASMFIDEAVNPDYCALFYSERWWSETFGRTPPGLIGAGSGLPLGTYYIGPWSQLQDHPLQHQGTGAYTGPWGSGVWTYRRGDGRVGGQAPPRLTSRRSTDVVEPSGADGPSSAV